MMKKYTLLTVVFFLLISCAKDDDLSVKDFTDENEQEILDFLEANDLVAQKSETGLYYIINELGDGEQPNLSLASSTNITVDYRGYFTNGQTFDESDSDGVTFGLGDLIFGFAEGVSYFKEGGEGLIIIPSRLAYGSFDFNGIPAGSVLVFDINLLDVETLN